MLSLWQKTFSRSWKSEPVLLAPTWQAQMPPVFAGCQDPGSHTQPLLSTPITLQTITLQTFAEGLLCARCCLEAWDTKVSRTRYLPSQISEPQGEERRQKSKQVISKWYGIYSGKSVIYIIHHIIFQLFFPLFSHVPQRWESLAQAVGP